MTSRQGFPVALSTKGTVFFSTEAASDFFFIVGPSLPFGGEHKIFEPPTLFDPIILIYLIPLFADIAEVRKSCQLFSPWVFH